MSLFVVDVESDGPCPGLYSMISFGAVLVDGDLSKTFYGKVKPLEGADRIEAAAAISNCSRIEHEGYPDIVPVMAEFAKWVREVNGSSRPTFVSDNPAFDWQFINYYFAYSGIENPFGWSARRIGDFYAGLTKNWSASWKHLRITRHTHNPVDDATGNAEALKRMATQFGVKIG
jgi:hypothetical protein